MEQHRVKSTNRTQGISSHRIALVKWVVRECPHPIDSMYLYILSCHKRKSNEMAATHPTDGAERGSEHKKLSYTISLSVACVMWIFGILRQETHCATPHGIL